MAAMGELYLNCEELAAWIMETMEIEQGTPAWDEWYGPVRDTITMWVDRRLLGIPFPTEILGTVTYSVTV